MKNWKIVWRNITGTIFSSEFDTFEELETWLAPRAEGIRMVAKTLTIWELYDNKYKMRHNWKRA